MIERPEFTAYEINQLYSMGRRCKKYMNIRTLIMSDEPLTEKQIKLLWAVKKELKGDE